MNLPINSFLHPRIHLVPKPGCGVLCVVADYSVVSVMAVGDAPGMLVTNVGRFCGLALGATTTLASLDSDVGNM